ncbi:MAG: FAD-dependent monooxygenase [Patescibacteria group bacterium]
MSKIVKTEKINTQVIIAGAGPTGLMLANQLERFGIQYILIDKKPSTVPESRAMGVQARILEFYEQLGIVDKALEQGKPDSRVEFYKGDTALATLNFDNINIENTKYSFIFGLEQNKNEKILLSNLKALNSIWFDTEILKVSKNTEKPSIVVSSNNVKKFEISGQYLVACDGSRSIVKESLGLDFVGKRYENDFMVMDMFGEFPENIGDITATVKQSTLSLSFALKEKNKYRLFVSVPSKEILEETEDKAVELALNNFPKGLKIDRVSWFSYYQVGCKKLDNFRLGNVFFAGDSAHIHSPAGGQGMNTGIGDAVNLGWKLAYTLKGKAQTNLLNTYNEERERFAKGLLNTTDKAFSTLVSHHWLARFTLNYVIVVVIWVVSNIRPVQRVIFRKISQVGLSYKGLSMSDGSVASFSGGDRMPNVMTLDDEGQEVESIQILKSTDFSGFYVGETEPKIKYDYEINWYKIKADSARKLNLPDKSYFIVRPDMHISKCGLVSD